MRPESGWNLSTDPAAARHWRPVAQGSLHSSHNLFRGRRNALSRIAEWLDRAQPDRRVLVITGMPGSGKSAVLARIVTTADATSQLPPSESDSEIIATSGSIACAIHAKGMTTLEVMNAIAHAASLVPPTVEEDFVSQIVEPISNREGRFNVVIDALDEAADPQQARSIISSVILPLCQVTSANAQVVVATRRRDKQGDLMRAFSKAETLIDLDDAEFFDHDDVVHYVDATLRLQDHGSPRNPYADSNLTSSVAQRIAAISDKNFLIAGLMAHYRRMYDQNVVPPSQISFSAKVSDVLNNYIERLRSDSPFARTAMTALAFAQGDGLTLSLWRDASAGLGASITEHDLMAFASTTGAAYLVEAESDAAQRTYRLFHPALNEALLEFRQQASPRRADEQQIVQTWMATWTSLGWAQAPQYLQHWLPLHAQRAAMVDAIMADESFLMHADLQAVLKVAHDAVSPLGRTRTRTLQLTPGAAGKSPASRRAMFTVTEALNKVDGEWDGNEASDYRVAWAQAIPKQEWACLIDNADAFTALCPFDDGESILVAAGDEEGIVRLWDPLSGKLHHVLEGLATHEVTGLCQVELIDARRLAIACEPGSIHIVDPQTQLVTTTLIGHTGRIQSICSLYVDGEPTLASVSFDGSARLWNLTDGSHRVLCSGDHWLTCVEPLYLGQEMLLAVGDSTGRIQLWNPSSGALERTYRGHSDRVTAMCTASFADCTVVASASFDQSIHLWNPTSCEMMRQLDSHGLPLTSICSLPTARGAVICASAGRSILAWNPADSSQSKIAGHTEAVRLLGRIDVVERSLLVSAGDDGKVNLWDPDRLGFKGTEPSSPGHVRGLCTAHWAGRTRVISANTTGRVDHWDLETGLHAHASESPTATPASVCGIGMGSGVVAIATGELIHIWDIGKDKPTHTLHGHLADIRMLASVQFREAAHLISTDDDFVTTVWESRTWQAKKTLAAADHVDGITCLNGWSIGSEAWLGLGAEDAVIRIWNLEAERLERTLHGHAGPISALEPVWTPYEVAPLLASGAEDCTVRLWSTASGEELTVLKGHKGSITSLASWRDPLGRILLVSASTDSTLRCWDVTSDQCLLTIPLHHRCHSVLVADGKMVVGLDAGLIAIDLATLSI